VSLSFLLKNPKGRLFCVTTPPIWRSLASV
jgi:hypothetical protein